MKRVKSPLFCHALGTRIVQLHGDIDRDELKRLKTIESNLTVIESLIIGIGDDKTLEKMVRELSPFRLSPTPSIQNPAHRVPPAKPTTGT
jgi:hypothetical protein